MACRLHRLISVLSFVLLLSAGKIFAEEIEDANAAPDAVAGIEENADVEESVSGKTDSEKTPASEKENYYKTTDENNKIKFIQKLSWRPVKDIAFYEIQIQKKNEDGYEEVLNQRLTEPMIEVSLEAGTYRFRVAVFDLFEKEANRSAWESFRVIKALQPEIRNVEPQTAAINDKKFFGQYTLKGLNFIDESVFRMKRIDEGEEQELSPEIIEISEDNNQILLQVPKEKLAEGNYVFTVTDPSGLSAESNPVKLKNKKDRTWEILFSAGYAMSIELMDGTVKKYTKNDVNVLAVNLRTSILAFHTKAGAIGFGLNGYWWPLSGETKNYRLTGNVMSAMGTIVYTNYFIPDTLGIEVHGGVGAGFVSFNGFEYKTVDFKSDGLNAMGLCYGGGVAVQYYPIKKHLYVELSLDFVDLCLSDMNYGSFIPSLSVGGRF